jgi:hypothetical protein
LAAGNFDSSTPGTPAVTGSATQSNGVHGITTSNKDSAVYGEHAGDGIGVFGRGGASAGQGVFGQTGSSTSAVHGENTSNGAGVVGVSQSGFGVVGESGSNYAFRAEGSASQALSGGGWIKAMIQVAGSAHPSIQRYFNSQSDMPEPTVYRLDIGLYSIDFHYDVSARYASVTAVSLPFLDSTGNSTFPENPFAPFWYPPPSGNQSQVNFVVASVVYDGLTGPPTAALGDPALRQPNKSMITVMTFQPVLQVAGGGNFVAGFQLKDATFSLAIF